MSLRMFSAVLAAAFLAVAAATPTLAQEKKLTAQQLKMKSCAGKWREEKAAKKVSGRSEYNKFMRGCLKS